MNNENPEHSVSNSNKRLIAMVFIALIIQQRKFNVSRFCLILIFTVVKYRANTATVHRIPLPINGIDSLVSGILSAMANINTENAKITVTPRAIFSPTNYH